MIGIPTQVQFPNIWWPWCNGFKPCWEWIVSWTITCIFLVWNINIFSTLQKGYYKFVSFIIMWFNTPKHNSQFQQTNQQRKTFLIGVDYYLQIITTVKHSPKNMHTLLIIFLYVWTCQHQTIIWCKILSC